MDSQYGTWERDGLSPKCLVQMHAPGCLCYIKRRGYVFACESDIPKLKLLIQFCHTFQHLSTEKHMEFSGMTTIAAFLGSTRIR